MNTRPRSSTAERFGRWLGRGWRGYVRRERRGGGVFVTAAAWASAANSPDEDAWPFTDMDELRNTPGYDPNLYNDHTHVDYKDD